eukprot:scaffold106841_cov60-Phaeocystis_antarctica.AAC.2
MLDAPELAHRELSGVDRVEVLARQRCAAARLTRRDRRPVLRAAPRGLVHLEQPCRLLLVRQRRPVRRQPREGLVEREPQHLRRPAVGLLHVRHQLGRDERGRPRDAARRRRHRLRVGEAAERLPLRLGRDLCLRLRRLGGVA